MLVVGHLDMLYLKDQDEGCCPVCCGPCWALKWLHDAGQLDDIVGSAGPGHHYWKQGVDPQWLEEVWRMTECHQVVDAELMTEGEDGDRTEILALVDHGDNPRRGPDDDNVRVS